MEHEHHQVPIWFFIGALLTVYGLLILGVGIYHLAHPPVQKVALYEKHADIWWGALLTVIGLIYGIRFWPGRSRQRHTGTSPEK
ncbi:MAG: hypothetical protein N3G20_10475 [Verrucomicrobiae bacterium]|nr:hypothetical protein [Verrucomicrobiae bacterium]